MNIRSIFSRPETYSEPSNLSPAEQARKKYDERVGSAVVQAYNWRRISLGLLLTCIVLSIGLIIQSTKSTVIPYVVTVDKNTGEVTNAGTLIANEYTPQQAEIKYFLREFIRNTREVPLDPVIYKNNWAKAYGYMTEAAGIKMNAQVSNDKISDKFGKETVQVTITALNQIEGSNSYTVNWIEETFNTASGEKINRPMTGVFTVTTIPSENEDTLNINPLGLYISDFNLSEEDRLVETTTKKKKK